MRSHGVAMSARFKARRRSPRLSPRIVVIPLAAALWALIIWGGWALIAWLT